MGDIVIFDGARRRVRAQAAGPEAVAAKGKRGQFPNNPQARNALVRMLVRGQSFRSVARKHPLSEEGLAQDIREALLNRGLAA